MKYILAGLAIGAGIGVILWWRTRPDPMLLPLTVERMALLVDADNRTHREGYANFI